MRRFAFSLVLFAATCCLAQPPPNDDFTNRIHLVGSDVSFTADTLGATWGYEPYEPDEPRPSNFPVRVIWWSWTAVESSPVIIEKVGAYTEVAGALAVFAGTNYPDFWVNKKCEMEFERHGHYAMFDAQAGTEYQIALAGYIDEPITIRLMATNAPQFRLQPITQTVSSNASVLFTAFAVGIKPLHYQWLRDGSEIPGATNFMLSLDGITWNNAGEYCVVVTNATGVSTSQVAKLLVSTNDPAPELAAVGMIGGTTFQFSVTGERGRWYRSEFSSNLKSWGGGIIFNTNETTSFTVANDMPAKFLRLSIHHPTSEICVNNLRQVRSALLLCAEENHLLDNDVMAPGWRGLDGYFINGTWPRCPSPIYQVDWYSYLVVDVKTTPTCWVGPPTHVLEDP